jgi:hypothetical protein
MNFPQPNFRHMFRCTSFSKSTYVQPARALHAPTSATHAHSSLDMYLSYRYKQSIKILAKAQLHLTYLTSNLALALAKHHGSTTDLHNQRDLL